MGMIIKKTERCPKCKDGRIMKRIVVFCGMCGYVKNVETKEVWTIKKVTETEEKKVKARTCPACGRIFKTINGMRNHYKRTHFN